MIEFSLSVPRSRYCYVVCCIVLLNFKSSGIGMLLFKSSIYVIFRFIIVAIVPIVPGGVYLKDSPKFLSH